MAIHKATPFKVLRGVPVNPVTDRPSVVAEADAEARNKAERAFSQAQGIIDLLQVAAAHGAIAEEPGVDESLAQTLDVVRDLLDTAFQGIWPQEAQS
jgi:hypothetical protein